MTFKFNALDRFFGNLALARGHNYFNYMCPVIAQKNCLKRNCIYSVSVVNILAKERKIDQVFFWMNRVFVHQEPELIGRGVRFR